jgi:hypothetical protein
MFPLLPIAAASEGLDYGDVISAMRSMNPECAFGRSSMDD